MSEKKTTRKNATSKARLALVGAEQSDGQRRIADAYAGAAHGLTSIMLEMEQGDSTAEATEALLKIARLAVNTALFSPFCDVRDGAARDAEDLFDGILSQIGDPSATRAKALQKAAKAYAGHDPDAGTAREIRRIAEAVLHERAALRMGGGVDAERIAAVVLPETGAPVALEAPTVRALLIDEKKGVVAVVTHLAILSGLLPKNTAHATVRQNLKRAQIRNEPHLARRRDGSIATVRRWQVEALSFGRPPKRGD